MRNSLCLLITVLVGASHQRATVVTRSGNEVDSVVFGDHVKQWQNISSDNGPTVLPGFTAADPSENDCRPCKCGAKGKKLGIYGGNPTYDHEYPWMAFIWPYDAKICGGSLINNKYVMTAAHCVLGPNGEPRDPENFSVLLLTRNVSDYENSKHLYNVSEVIIHYGYDAATNDFDIALIRLDTDGLDIGPGSEIHPVCLPTKGESYDGYLGVVTGWGDTEEGVSSLTLLETNVPIISNEECRSLNIMPRMYITDSMMCAGYMKGKKDSCKGDSGGPLVINDNSTYHVVGIVAWGDGCGNPKKPGVYTRVNFFLDWLADNTKDACSCTAE